MDDSQVARMHSNWVMTGQMTQPVATGLQNTVTDLGASIGTTGRRRLR